LRFRLTRWATGLLLVPAASLFVGCGGSADVVSSGGPRLTHAQYQAAITRIELSPLVGDMNRLFFQLAAGDVSERGCRDGARRFAEDVHTVVERVAKLRAPQDVAGLQDRLVEAGRKTDAQIERLADDVEAGNVSCGQPWNQRAYGLASTDQARQVIVELGNRGYGLALNSE
jgi:hypothetical protein